MIKIMKKSNPRHSTNKLPLEEITNTQLNDLRARDERISEIHGSIVFYSFFIMCIGIPVSFFYISVVMWIDLALTLLMLVVFINDILTHKRMRKLDDEDQRRSGRFFENIKNDFYDDDVTFFQDDTSRMADSSLSAFPYMDETVIRNRIAQDIENMSDSEFFKDIEKATVNMVLNATANMVRGIE